MNIKDIMQIRGMRHAFGIMILGLGIHGTGYAFIYPIPLVVGQSCSTGTLHMGTTIGGDCELDEDVQNRYSGNAQFAGDGNWGLWDNFIKVGRSVYVPKRSQYVMHWAFCDNTTHCTIAKSHSISPPTGALTIEPTLNLLTNDIKFPHGNSIIGHTHDGMVCGFFEDTSTGEKLVPSTEGLFCNDVNTMPTTPPKCTVNNGNGLTVTYNNINLSSIGTSVDNSMSGDSVKMPTFSVTCERMSEEAIAKLSGNTVNMGGSDVVKTSLDGLGVAVSLNGNPLGGGKTAPIRGGVTGPETQTMRFQLVRDPSKRNISGAFDASATLILTEQ